MNTTALYNNKGNAAVGGISGFTIKMIAVVTMLIDHVAASLLERILMQWNLGDSWEFYYNIYQVMRDIGRLAFPIYIFLLVEGFTYTRSKRKYAGRMFLFAIISEIPFDMAFNGCVLELYSNNVFITLFLGLITISMLDAISQSPKIVDTSDSPVKWLLVNIGKCIAMAAIVLVMMVVAKWLLKCDYGEAGIAAIVGMYLLRNYKEVGFAVAVLLLAFFCGEIELWALIALIPIHFYNGTRGRSLKYFFYAFYPVHLLVIAGIGYLIGLGL